MSRQKEIPGYLYSLDGLRALGMILVWMYHAFQQSWLFARFPSSSAHPVDLTLLQRHGYVAIDAFFVLSGFCLFYPVARHMFEGASPINWKNFYYKRAKKIWPSYLFMLLILFIFPILSYGTAHLSAGESFKHFISHAFFVHNFSASTIGTTISTAWTMAMEVQFYLVFPLFAYLMRKKPILTLIGTTVFSEGLRLYMCMQGETSTHAQSNTLLYYDIFVWGMAAAYAVVWARNNLPKLKNTRVRYAMTALSVASLGFVYMFMKWMDGASYGAITGGSAQTMFRMIYRPLLAFGFALFIFATSNAVSWYEKKVWGNRVFIFLSTISYNFYLWHQNIHIFFKEVTPAGIPAGIADVATASQGTRLLYVALTLAVSLAIAVLTTYLIEIPFAKYGFRGYLKNIKNKLVK